MSYSQLKDSVIAALDAKATSVTNRAINMRVRAASDGVPATTTDEYALIQIEALAEARAYADAIRTVIAEYKKMTEPEKIADISEAKQQTRRPIYG